MLTKINSRIKRRQKGFTLIELLLVVAILAVLAFLAVPAIASTIRNARVRTCASNENIIENSVWRMYTELVAMGVSQPFAEVPRIGAGYTGIRIWAPTAAGDWALEVTVSTIPLVVNTYLLSDYFRPSKTPTCPFDTTAVPAYEIYLELDRGVLVDTLAVCESSGLTEATGLHTRPLDRPAPWSESAP